MRVRRRQRAALTHLLLLEALDVTVLAAELRSRAGWVSTLLLKTLLEQSNHPAQGLPPPGRVGQHAAIGMATERSLTTPPWPKEKGAES